MSLLFKLLDTFNVPPLVQVEVCEPPHEDFHGLAPHVDMQDLRPVISKVFLKIVLFKLKTDLMLDVPDILA